MQIQNNKELNLFSSKRNQIQSKQIKGQETLYPGNLQQQTIQDKQIQIIINDSKTYQNNSILRHNQSNKIEIKMSSRYLAQSILRALDNPNLSKVDVGRIFDIQTNKIIQISKTQSIDVIMKILQSRVYKSEDKTSKSYLHRKYNSGQSGQYDCRNEKRRNITKENQIDDNSKTQMYAKTLLRNYPKYQLTTKLRSLIKIVKQNPNICQRDIIKKMAEEQYGGFKGMTQTTISRYMKKLDIMRKHVQILIRAKNQAY